MNVLDIFDKKINKIENESDNDDEDDLKSYLRKIPTEPPTGIPDYITSGSHTFAGTRYRFLILPRYERDLHSLIKNSRVDQKYVLILAIQIIDILEKLHDKGYCHNDIKAQNLMISQCKYQQEQSNLNMKKMGQNAMNERTKLAASNICSKQEKNNIKYESNDEKQQTTDSGNSSEQEEINEQTIKKNHENHDNFLVRDTRTTVITNTRKNRRNNMNGIIRKDSDANVTYYKTTDATHYKKDVDVDEDEDFDYITTTNSTTSGSSQSVNTYQQKQVILTSSTPAINKLSESHSSQPSTNNPKDSTANHSGLSTKIQYSGSNPIRSCRRGQEKLHPIYEEMVKSHYLRPAKRVSYLEFFIEDNMMPTNKNYNNPAIKNSSCYSSYKANNNDLLRDAPKNSNYYRRKKEQPKTGKARSVKDIERKNHKMQINSSEDDNGNSDDDDKDCDYIEYLSPMMRQKLIGTKGTNMTSENNNNYNCKRLTRQQALQQKRIEEMKNNNQLLNTQQQIVRTTNVVNDDKAKLVKNDIKIESDDGDLKSSTKKTITVEKEHVFLIDYGLASKYIDNGTHRPFVMDQRRAHDGTLESTSRDAHMGAHSRRSDMECLGYNLLFWSEGYLPWKDAANLQQPEKVHRAKEYLMTDVREMLKQIYGSEIPKYLGEYLHLVGQLSYHERPDYDNYRRIFQNEYKQRGYDNYTNNKKKTKKTSRNSDHSWHNDKNDDVDHFRLSMHEIQMTCKPFQEKEIETTGKTDFFEMVRIVGIANISPITHLNNLNFHNQHHLQMTPYNDHALCNNRVSPKYLRSKSGKKKQFSWAEVLSQDPDQIARQRAEKEFDREDELSEIQQTVTRRYQGNPTYAILQLQQRLQRQRNDYQYPLDQQIDWNNQNAKQIQNCDLLTSRNGIPLHGQQYHQQQYQNNNKSVASVSTFADEGRNKCLLLNNNIKKTTNNTYQNNINCRSNSRKSPIISENNLPVQIDLANDKLQRCTSGGKVAKSNSKSTTRKKTPSAKKTVKTILNCRKKLWDTLQSPSSANSNTDISKSLNQKSIGTGTSTTSLKSTTKSKKNRHIVPKNEENSNNDNVKGAINTPAINATGRRRRQARRCLAAECQKYHNFGAIESTNPPHRYKRFNDVHLNFTEENN